MLIIPAILSDDSEKILDKIRQLKGETEWIQIDFADSTMTEDSTFDLYDLVGEVEDFEVEVHLMTAHPENYLEACDTLNASRVYFHLGEVESPSQVLDAMDPYDFTKGMALSPQTPVEDVFTYIDEIDALQIMTVVPGAQGGVFLPEMLDKVTYARERRTDIWIAVDGGMNTETIEKAKELGVDAVGVGSAIFESVDVVKNLYELKEKYEV
jgi:ribulose-phosphate 3-epimerase